MATWDSKMPKNTIEKRNKHGLAIEMVGLMVKRPPVFYEVTSSTQAVSELSNGLD